MTSATMMNKQTGEVTILIDKAEVDQLRADLEKARTENIGLNVQVILLQADLDYVEELYKAYDKNILCRGIIWLQFFIKRIVKYIIGKIRARWEEDE